MHVSSLGPEMFRLEVDGLAAGLTDVFPALTVDDRLGVVVRTPYGGMGASHLVTLAVARFYREQQLTGEVYPDYFVFSVGQPRGDHSMLDIWPPHRFVDVLDDAEQILQAVNDRGITRLLVESTPASEPQLGNWTMQSALRRIVSAVVFHPSGTVHDGDVTLAAEAAVEQEIGLQLDPDRIVRESEGYADFLAYYAKRRDEVDAVITGRLRKAREQSIVDGLRVETYKRIAPREALSMLQTS